MSLSLGHLPTHLPEIVATALSCQGLMALADPLSRLVAGKKYAELSGTRRMDWRSRVVSFVFATGILIESFRLMGGKGYASLKADKVFGYSPEGGRLAGVAVGYFIWDTILCLRYWKVFGASFLVHGLSCLTVMLLGLRPFLMYYGPRVLLFEASTPFLNINYWLDKLGMTGGKLQLVNGVLLLAAFAGSRIVWGWGITWDFITELYSRRGTLNPVLPWTFVLFNITLNSLNIYWFYKMVQSIAKRFKKDDGKKTEDGKKEE